MDNMTVDAAAKEVYDLLMMILRSETELVEEAIQQVDGSLTHALSLVLMALVERGVLLPELVFSSLAYALAKDYKAGDFFGDAERFANGQFE